MLRRVVLPAPLAPIIAVVLPDLNMPLMSFRIYLSLYAFEHGIFDFTLSSNTFTE